MATTTKKGSKNKRAKLRGSVVKTSAAEQAQTIAELRQELAQSLQRENSTAKELREALEQQTATSEILGVIASSPMDIQPVLETIAENAAKVTESQDAVIYHVHGNALRRAAKYGPLPWGPIGEIGQVLSRGTIAGRAVIDRQMVHVPDMEGEGFKSEFPDVRRRIQYGIRSGVATPLLREGVPIGVIYIRRNKLEPFTDKQIALLKTFADQAVIAIENVRLFKEFRSAMQNCARHWSIRRRPAEVLGIISRSPTDVQPVLDAIVESAARVCGIDDVVLRLREGNVLVSRAHFGPLPVPASRIEISIEEPQYRWMREHGTLHVPDVSKWNDFQVVSAVGWRSRLTAPLYQQGEIVGILNARRTEVRPFTPAQIKLLETFADQAVIAIENVRLFQELKESLEQQTATSEILGVIASSPTDIQPVLDVVAENAARLCDATNAQVFRFDGECLATRRQSRRRSVKYGSSTIRRSSPLGRVFVDRKTLHVHDLAAELETEFPDAKASQQRLGHRTILGTPLLREGVPIGVIGLRRTEVRPFTEKQIKLLETFADQAVIAIENVRLFQELKESLEQQTATSEILGVIASSPTDIQPVLDVVAENAARLCEATMHKFTALKATAYDQWHHYRDSSSTCGIQTQSSRGLFLVERFLTDRPSMFMISQKP